MHVQEAGFSLQKCGDGRIGVEVNPIVWWATHVLLALTSCFFMLFGIVLLVAAYHLEDPFSFAMTFFASNLIILISAALLAGFICRMVSRRKRREPSEKDGVCSP